MRDVSQEYRLTGGPSAHSDLRSEVSLERETSKSGSELGSVTITRTSYQCGYHQTSPQ